MISIDAQRYFWAHTFFTDYFYVVVCQLLTMCFEISRNKVSGGASVCEHTLQNPCENNRKHGNKEFNSPVVGGEGGMAFSLWRCMYVGSLLH